MLDYATKSMERYVTGVYLDLQNSVNSLPSYRCSSYCAQKGGQAQNIALWLLRFHENVDFDDDNEKKEKKRAHDKNSFNFSNLKRSTHKTTKNKYQVSKRKTDVWAFNNQLVDEIDFFLRLI